MHPPTELDPDSLDVAAAPSPEAPPGADPAARPHVDGLGVALAVTAGTTAVVTALSWLAPSRHAATLVGLAFLGATWWRVLRKDEATIRWHGLALGGLLEPVRIDPRRLARAALVSAAWAALFAALAFPAFFFGFRAYYHVGAHHFAWRMPSALDDVSGQLLVIALPEEAFFRGYLQTALDGRFPPRWRVLGADLGPGWLVSAAIFAVGHVLTTPNPGRLAVFFPALLFGWLRARTRGIGAGVGFHAACNLFSAALSRGYGLGV